MKISEYLYFSTGLCCIVFGENRNSLNIQNGGPKFSKFAYLSKISQFCSDFKTKYIFVISMTVLFRKYTFLCVWASTSGLKILLSVYTKTSISLDLTNRFWWNFIFKMMRIFSMVLSKNMTSRDTDDVIPGKIRYLTRTAKSGVNVIGFLSKFQNIFFLVRIAAV